uniref:Kinesin-like protein n=1 Tax=Blastobotrys adeninivorans TaxID=409370 RepID=A0A060TD55_BLAAD
MISPTKRTGTPRAGSLRSCGSSANLSRPQTPQLMRRPASSASMRSPTPLSVRTRPQIPSWNQGTTATYSGNIKVAVRVKPASDQGPWLIDQTRNTIGARDLGHFEYDAVFDSVSNQQIFDSSVSDLVDKVVQGYNATVFAYGMTGSGKTYSMQGVDNDPGVIPLAVNAIYSHIDSQPTRTFDVRVAYLEIYNEQLHDLLSPGSTTGEDIRLREAPGPGGSGIRATGLKEVSVNSPQQLLDTIASGDAVRRTAGTEWNARSSRSHAVVQISISSSAAQGSQGHAHSATLYLCDLAGSERAVQASDRRKEGAYINKSLLTLGTVIARLSAGGGGHVPYRDSKLTRLLQPALSGRALVSVLCTVQTAPSAYTETVSTLRFAARARNVSVNVKRNDDEDFGDLSGARATIESLMHQVAAQKLEIEQLKAASRESNHVAQLEAENKVLHERVEHLTRLCDDSRLEAVLGLDDEDSGKEDSQAAASYTHQIDEYKSYISHLERQLYRQALSHPRASSPEASPALDSDSMSGRSTPRHNEDLIRDLRDEIEELRESNADKDRIIAALRSLNRRRENLVSSLSGSSTSSVTSVSTPYSPAYSRYYFGSSASLQSPSFSESDEDETLRIEKPVKVQ